MRSTTAWSSGLREIETDLRTDIRHSCPVTLVATIRLVITAAANRRDRQTMMSVRRRCRMNGRPHSGCGRKLANRGRVESGASASGGTVRVRFPPQAELAWRPTNDRFGEPQMAFPAAGLGRKRTHGAKLKTFAPVAARNGSSVIAGAEVRCDLGISASMHPPAESGPAEIHPKQ